MIIYQIPLLKRIVIGCMLLWSFTTYAQKIDLSGTVTSMDGNPVPGLTLTLANAQMKDTTDNAGNFIFNRGGTIVISTQKKSFKNSATVNNFICMDKYSRFTFPVRNNQTEIFDLRGKSISQTNTLNIRPGIYLTKIWGDARQNSARHLAATSAASVDSISITYKDSLLLTVAVESYIDTLNIKFSGKIPTILPQCFADDKMPLNPVLTVDPDVKGVTTVISNNSYVAMLLGPDRPACITDAVAKRNITFLDEGLREVVEVVGFPAFPEWKKGYFLNWVILNSGIPGATLPDEGGHQGDRWGHMNFESTKTCPCTWDDYQSGGALHECVHALQAEQWKYNNQASGWVHEAHNNYLTTMAQGLVHNKYGIGWSASLILNMPFVPLESMGLCTDDYVAGPADQGADSRTYISTQVRYGGEVFFLSLSQIFGRGFVNCLWINAPVNGQKSIFQVMRTFGGDEIVATAIMSFAAKCAILDFEKWTETMRTLMKTNWNNSYWFYMFPGGDGTTTFSPTAKTTPHHQGRNIIPIKLASGATSVSVEFTPDALGSKGTAEKMQAQLVYRDNNDKPVYGTIFTSGQSTITVPNGAKGGIVNFVVAVVNPNAASGSDDGSNKGFNGQEHFSYKARIVSGGTIGPNTTRPY